MVTLQVWHRFFSGDFPSSWVDSSIRNTLHKQGRDLWRVHSAPTSISTFAVILSDTGDDPVLKDSTVAWQFVKESSTKKRPAWRQDASLGNARYLKGWKCPQALENPCVFSMCDCVVFGCSMLFNAKPEENTANINTKRFQAILSDVKRWNSAELKRNL